MDKLIRYNFNNYNNEVNKYLEDLYLNSLRFYKNHYKGANATGTTNLDLETIDKSIGYVEDYLNYFHKKYPSKFLDVFTALKNNLKELTVLDPNSRGLYGEFLPTIKRISINPQLSGSKTLTKDERTRLYLCHELGHAVHNEWIKTIGENVRDEELRTQFIVSDGFYLLDEATTQNTAEDIAYYYAKKKRPSQQYYSGRLFSGASYKSNFDFYGNLQEPATMFSRTLRGIGSEDNDDRALKLLSIRALNKNFVKKIFYEYKRDGQRDNLILLMSYLGIIKKASYATFGCDNPKYIELSTDAFSEVKKLAGSLRDYRPPFK